MVTNNHEIESLSGCLEIFAKEINPLLYNLASGRFLEQGQKATFFANLSKCFSLVASIDLPLEPLELGLNGLHFS